MKATHLVVTDLDGTLLDHHTYSRDAAAEALALLQSRHIPLVLCSSKTAAEMAVLHEALAPTDPFIVENGAAVYLPDGNGNTECASFGLPRQEVLERLGKIKSNESFACTGFSEMTVADVMAATGLEEGAAANALQREFTEPVLWQDTEAARKRFLGRLRGAGLDAVQGGRFLHVSAGCDKGRAVTWLRRRYAGSGAEPVVIALGDSDNDVSMLECADIPVLVKSPVRDFPDVRQDRVIRTTLEGPAGWNAAILQLLGDES